MPRRPGPVTLHKYSGVREFDGRAACVDLPINWFFPKHSRSKDAKRAVGVCNQCPVKRQCGEFALGNKVEWGVWGGMTEADRRRVWKLGH